MSKNFTKMLEQYSKVLEEYGQIESEKKKLIKDFEDNLTFKIAGINFRIVAHALNGDENGFKPSLSINGHILSPNETKKLIQKLRLIFHNI